MVRLGLSGLGKMGLSHLAIAHAHRDVKIVAVCDSHSYILETFRKYADFRLYAHFEEMLDKESLDAVIIATPARLHASMVRAALDHNLHVFCEKPFTLDADESLRLASEAETKNLVNQVGYHHRFIATFGELKRLVDEGLIGRVHSFRVEAYGPVVLHPQTSTWRSSHREGGGCLYEYASHAIDLTNFVFGRAQSIRGTALNRIFSRDVEDEVYAILFYPDRNISGQLSCNWSDASFRKMFTRMTVWGEKGRIAADRQEIQTYVHDPAPSLNGLHPGWNIRYTTDLTDPVDFYLRGEEYSAQLDHFVTSIRSGSRTRCSFREACDTDFVTSAILTDAAGRAMPSTADMGQRSSEVARTSSLWGRMRGRAGSPVTPTGRR